MDLLALITAVCVMTTVVIFFLWAKNAHAESKYRTTLRLEGLLSGASPVERPKSAPPLRESNRNLSQLLQDTSVELERADLTLKASEYWLMRIVFAGMGFVLPLLIFGLAPIGALVAIAAAVVGFMLPRMYVTRRLKSRVSKLNAQLPEALTLVSNSLKAGFGLLQSLDLAAREMPHPISTELNRAIHEMNVGSSVEEALVAMNDRCNSYDMDLVVTAILVQRTIGGNLSEILETVAETMRERERIKGEISTLTAQQKMTGVVIALLPVAVALLFFVVSPDYIMPLFTTVKGKMMLVTTGVMESIGVLVIKRILAIEV